MLIPFFIYTFQDRSVHFLVENVRFCSLFYIILY
nr:MAG TPA: Protein of unknown function (DUF2770) [Caudoviricetes sp.]